MPTNTASTNHVAPPAQPPAQARSWYAIRRPEAGSATLSVQARAGEAPVQAVAEISIVGPIGESWWEETVSAKQFLTDLEALPKGDLVVRIATDGGSVTDGMRIYNALLRWAGNVTTVVDPHAYSVGSLIAMAGKRRIMSSNGLMMLHGPANGEGGNALQHRQFADMLDSYAAAMATSYATATGKPRAEFEALFATGADHFYTADEALAAGLVTEITEGAVVNAALQRDMVSAMHKRLSASPTTSAAARAPAAPVSTPAASTATTPKEPPLMPNTTTQPEGVEAARREGVAAEAKRRDAITAAAGKHLAQPGVGEVVATCIADVSCTFEQASVKILAALGAQTTPAAGGRVVTTEDERDKWHAAATNAILARAGSKGADGKVIAADSTNPLRGMTMMEIVKASLQRNGRNHTGMDPMEVVGSVFQSTSDFPILLQNIMHKSLQSAYATQPDTWSRFCAVGSVTDFRAHNRYRLGSLGNLQIKNEAGEYKHMAIPDAERASVGVTDKGGIIMISREMIVNDDLSAFTTLPAALGRAARRSIEAEVYALLISNPLMSDGKALFHVDHGNIAANGAAPSVLAIDAMRQQMASQKDVSGNDPLDLMPAVSLSPLSLGAALRVINSAVYDPDTVNKLQRPNAVANLFRDIVDSSRLSGTAWYMLADKDVAPTIEVSFLNGNQVPRVEQETSFTTQGGRMRVSLDWGVTAVDYRGAVRNAGA